MYGTQTAEQASISDDRFEADLLADYVDEIQRLFLSGRFASNQQGWGELAKEAWTMAVAGSGVGAYNGVSH